jgi:hypothetical protein
MQRALLRAGIDAAKILGRAPLINACLTEPLFFLSGCVDRALLRFADEPNYAPRFNCLKLGVDLTFFVPGNTMFIMSSQRVECAAPRVSFWHSQSNASAHSNRQQTERADVDISKWCPVNAGRKSLNYGGRILRTFEEVALSVT